MPIDSQKFWRLSGHAGGGVAWPPFRVLPPLFRIKAILPLVQFNAGLPCHCLFNSPFHTLWGSRATNDSFIGWKGLDA
jgi:hypothetical protein